MQWIVLKADNSVSLVLSLSGFSYYPISRVSDFLCDFSIFCLPLYPISVLSGLSGLGNSPKL